jgi:hypothetical protein
MTGFEFVFRGPSFTFNANSSINAQYVELSAATVTEAGTYDVTAQTQRDGPGVTTFTAPITDLGSDLDMVTGTINLPGQSFSFATVENYGTINGGGAASLTVTGTMTWVGGTVTGFGTLEIPSGATVNLGNGNQTTETLNGVALENAGTVAWSTGTLAVTNGGAVDNMAGTVFGTPGNTGSLNLNTGTPAGSGAINANVTNSGEVVPEGIGAAGVLAINGSYTQTVTGALNVELGGTSPGTGYDQLAVSGAASLAGTLNIATVNAFQPAFGNQFQVLNFGSSTGNFGTYNAPSLPAGLFLDPVLNATGLTLDIDQVAITGAPAFPMEGTPINLAATVTGPSAGGSFTFSWTVTQNSNAFASGTGSTFSFTPNINGTYVVTLNVGDVAGGSGTTSLTLIVAPSILVVNPSASSALSVSGNVSINIPGEIVVDSSSSTALTASGNAQITAAVIDVAGGFNTNGNAGFNPAPTTGASTADPLAGLAGPGTSGLTNYGSVSFTSGAHTIGPGIYSQIKVSGNASLTLSAGSGGSPGIYIIEGGGLMVTGNASLSGQNVFLYNTGSNYPSSGGDFGGITLSGNGTFNLGAPTSGTYAGVAIFQSRANTRALSFSGNAMSGMSGIIYAPSALLSFTGNSQLQAALDVGMLNLSGNVALTQTAAGSDGSGDTSGIANTLLAGDLTVYINDPNGLFTANELSRIQDAVNAWDAILAPCNVTITEVSDPTSANMVIDTSNTSACGGASDGVLGCFNAPNAEITMVQGWNWYAGSDATQVGPGQYDFETTMLHELGHALGLGGSTNSSSPMYETLAAGTANRTVTTQDLNIPDPPAGADPQMASGFHFGSTPAALGPSGFFSAVGSGPSTSHVGLVALPSALGVAESSFSTGRWSPQPPETVEMNVAGREPSMIVQATATNFADRRSPDEARTALVFDAVLDELAAYRDQLPVEEGRGTTGAGARPQPGEAEGHSVADLSLLRGGLFAHAATKLVPLGTTSRPAVVNNADKMPLLQAEPSRGSNGTSARLVDLVLAAGLFTYGAGVVGARRQRVGVCRFGRSLAGVDE